MKRTRRKARLYLLSCVFTTFLLLTLAPLVRADMALTEANKAYAVRFQDWVFIYLNTEFIRKSLAAPDYSVEMEQKIVNNKVRFIISGYYFDTKLGMDWYARYGSQLESRIALLCHSWTQQGYPINTDDFEIHIEKEKLGSR